jgi:hypothetical protein
MMLHTPVCSYPIIISHLSFNFLCLLLLYSIYLNAQIFQPPQQGFFSVHAQLQLLGKIVRLLGNYMYC